MSLKFLTILGDKASFNVLQNTQISIIKIEKTDMPLIDFLSLTLFSLNFLNLLKQEPYTVAKRHIQEDLQAKNKSFLT